MSEFREWADQAVGDMFSGSPNEDEDPELDDEQDPESDDGEASEADAAAFWSSLTADEYDLAEADEEARARLWEAWLDANGVEDDEGDESNEDESADGDAVPTTGWQVVQVVLAAEQAGELLDEDGEPIDAASWLAWSLKATEPAYAKAARAAGWPNVRPSHEDVKAAGLAGSVLASDWAEEMAARRQSIEETGRGYFGS